MGKFLLYLWFVSTFVVGQSSDALNPENLAKSTVEEAANHWYFENWCGYDSLEYLHDSKCQKIFPSLFDRKPWSCPIHTIDEIPPGFQRETDFSNIEVDTETLQDYVNKNVNLCMVIIKRVLENDNTILYNKYLCAGELSKKEAYQPWSSTKIFAMANAAGHLRTNETTCSPSTFGLDGSTSGQDGVTPFGDLSTIIVSYDSTAGYSSNAVSSYMHDIGWRQRMYDLVRGWLGAEGEESLGGNYGASTPEDLSFEVRAADTEASCVVDRDPWQTVYDNCLSALSEVELTRRIVLHSDIIETNRYPGVQEEDILNILYGANDSTLFPGLQWGGMSTDTAIFLQSCLNMTQVEQDSQGRWRIFSKLGAGFIREDQADVLDTSYACLPKLNERGAPVEGEGWEFLVTARASIPGDPSLEKAEQAVLMGFKGAVGALLEGKLV